MDILEIVYPVVILINKKGETKMKTYKIGVRDEYEIEANSPKEAEKKFIEETEEMDDPTLN